MLSQLPLLDAFAVYDVVVEAPTDRICDAGAPPPCVA